jgi:hypothetical protein
MRRCIMRRFTRSRAGRDGMRELALAAVWLLGVCAACARRVASAAPEATPLARACAVSDSQLARGREAGVTSPAIVCRQGADSVRAVAPRPASDSSPLGPSPRRGWIVLQPDTAAPRRPGPATPLPVSMMPCVAGLDSAVLAYHAASADRDARPLRSLGGPHTCLGEPSDVAVTGRGELFVLSRGPYVPQGGWTNAVTVFAPGDSGDAAPRRRILVPPSFNNPALGLGLDQQGNLYVPTEEYPPALETPPPARRLGGAVRVYAPDADSAATPIRVLAGEATQLSQPVDVGFDRRGYMYVISTAGRVTVHDANAQGNVAPRRIITGPHTGLRLPIKLGFGAGDTLFVLNAYTWNRFGTEDVTVTVYLPGATGDVAPLRTLVVKRGRASEGGRRHLSTPKGLAVDDQGFIYIAITDGSAGAGAIAVYPPGAEGDAAPVRRLGGRGTGLLQPRGVALDSHGGLYVTNVPVPTRF